MSATVNFVIVKVAQPYILQVMVCRWIIDIMKLSTYAAKKPAAIIHQIFRPQLFRFRSGVFLFWSHDSGRNRKTDPKCAVVWPRLVLEICTGLALV